MPMKPFESVGSMRPLSRGSERDADESTCFDGLTGAVNALGNCFSTMHEQYEQLQKVNDSFIEFNNSFSAFLFGLASSTSALRWPQAPTKESFEQFKSKTAGAEENTRDQSTAQKQQQQQQQQQQRQQYQETTGTRAKRRKTMSTPSRKSGTKINIQKIVSRLPIPFRDDNERIKILKEVLSTLRDSSEGMNIRAIVAATKIPQHKITECLNVLVHCKDVIKYNQKGVGLYKLDPIRYPPTTHS